MHSYRGGNLKFVTDGRHIRRKHDWRLLGGRYGPIYLAFLLSFLPFSLNLQSMPFARAVLPRERVRWRHDSTFFNPGAAAPARPSSVRVRPSSSVCLCRPSRRSESGCWGKVGVDRGCWVERSECSSLRKKSQVSLSLHHSLQESRHITRADKFTTFLHSSLHHTTLHGHTDRLVVDVLWTNRPDHSLL